MKKTYLVAMLLVVVRAAMGAEIVFSGGTTVCPNISYTYTAQAAGAFGPQKGCFQWSFFVNDQLISVAGSAPCDCGSSFSTSTATMTWGTVTTNAKIRIDFVADDIWPGCPVSSKTVNVVVRVVTPESITDANGGLTFCSANQTRTVSVPPSTACNWNHNYDWILPSGWTAVPSSASFSYVSIPNGIRTKSNSVNVKAPATVTQGYAGNYFITVKTEPNWPYPKQISRQIYVGLPQTPSIPDYNAVDCPEILFTTTSFPNVTYTWYSRLTSFPTPNEYPNSPNTKKLIYYQDGSYEVGVKTVNVCGSSVVRSTSLTIACNGGGGHLTIYPNPATEAITVNWNESDMNLYKDGYEVVIEDTDLKQKKSYQLKNKAETISTKEFLPGQYILKIRHKKGEITNHLVIE